MTYTDLSSTSIAILALSGLPSSLLVLVILSLKAFDSPLAAAALIFVSSSIFRIIASLSGKQPCSLAHSLQLIALSHTELQTFLSG